MNKTKVKLKVHSIKNIVSDNLTDVTVNPKARVSQDFFIFDQTCLIVAINTAIQMSTNLFSHTHVQDKYIISYIRNTLVKLKSSFVQKLSKNVTAYEKYLDTSTIFFQHMVLLAFGVNEQERNICLLYISKIVQFLNSKHTGKSNNFLFIEYNEQTTIQEVKVYGTEVYVLSEGQPEHYDRVLIYSSEFTDTLLAYYDKDEKVFLLDDGTKINPTVDLRWLSITELTKSLNIKNGTDTIL